MPTTPTQRKRSKKVTSEPLPTINVDLSILLRDWKAAKKRVLRYVASKQHHTLAQLQFISHIKPYCQRQLDDRTVELYQRVVTKSLNAKWINKQFTATQLLVALATICHHDKP